MTSADIATDLLIELTPVERLLMRTPLLALGEFRCPIDHPQFRGGGPQACAYVVFPRTAVRISPHRGRPEVCTPALAVYYNVGDSYERHGLGEQGDHCDWIAVSQTLLRELIGEEANESTQSGFAGAFSPIASRCFLTQRRIFNRVGARQDLSALEIEEAVVPLLQHMLTEANGRWKREGGNARSSRPATEVQRRRIVEEAKQLIATNFTEDMSLSDLAGKTGCSPGHLARSFRALTGTTLHEYRNQLRLRSSLPMLPDFRQNIASLAIELGFASHSHFGDSFRRHFGLTPSDYVDRPQLN